MSDGQGYFHCYERSDQHEKGGRLHNRRGCLVAARLKGWCVPEELLGLEDDKNMEEIDWEYVKRVAQCPDWTCRCQGCGQRIYEGEW